MASSQTMDIASTRAALAKALLNPDSVALFGVSGDDAMSESRPLKFLRAQEFKGKVYCISPGHASVQGERAYADLASLPEVPDHVFVLTPAESVVGIVEECGRLGVKVVTVRVSGFSESGPEGVQREQALRDICARTGVRVVGPGSLGVIIPGTGLVLTANATFSEPLIPDGRVFVASHSGSMVGALVSHGKSRGIGFAGLVAMGNEADLSVGEICALTLDDPDIGGYVLFLENLRSGGQLRAFALEAARRGKPVIAYKLGRSDAAAEMSVTHTGALAGEDDIADAFLKDLGIARVGIMESLLECLPLAMRIPLRNLPHAPPRVGIVTTTGGGAAMAVDQLAIRGVVVQPPSAETLGLLHAAGIEASAGRVVDLTLAGTKYEVMKKAIDILLGAPEFDMVLAVVGSSARFQPKQAVRPIIDCASSARPLAAMVIPDANEALAMLANAGVPCFRTPESCGDSIAAVFAPQYHQHFGVGLVADHAIHHVRADFFQA